MVMIVVAVPAVAPFARFFQIMAAGLRLAAVFTVLALSIAQPALRIADSLLALSVVVPVHRPRGRRTAQERENNQRRNKRSDLLEHASSSACPYILLLDAYSGT